MTRAGCHLCDQVRPIVAEVTASLGLTFDEVDVDGDPQLQERFSEMVPVIVVDGQVHNYWRVDPGALRAALEAPSSRHS